MPETPSRHKQTRQTCLVDEKAKTIILPLRSADTQERETQTCLVDEKTIFWGTALYPENGSL